LELALLSEISEQLREIFRTRGRRSAWPRLSDDVLDTA